MSDDTDLIMLRRMKDKSEKLKEQADKAKGALDGALASLKEEFDCDSILAGENLLSEMKAKLEVSETEFKKAVEEFEAVWKEGGTQDGF